MQSDYPLAMLLIGAGFFIICIVEIMVSRCQTSGTDHSEHGHSHNAESALTESTKLFDNAKSQSAIYTMLFGLSGLV